jgi:uncharacterized repeat protein (TIGR01451 family)
LRSFEIWTCNSAASDCAGGTGFTKIYTSPADAFPGAIPRPGSPDLISRTFAVPTTTATHVRLVVLTNQCTGIPGIQNDADNDPLNDSGCVTGSTRDNDVFAAELEVFARAGADLSVTKTGPAAVKKDTVVTYSVAVKNNGPQNASGVKATDTLPVNAEFKTATPSQGSCTKATANQVTTLTCSLGNLANGATATITVTAKLRNVGAATNTVSATETAPGDPDSSNNTATVTTAVS